MITELARELVRLRMPGGASLTVDEITDILWLAPAYIGSDPRMGAESPPAPPDPSDPAGSTASPPAAADLDTPEPATAPSIPVYLPTTDTTGPTRADEPPSRAPSAPQREPRAPASPKAPAPASQIAFRSPPALPDALELTRALRGFKQVTRPGRPQVDIEASVQATADAGQLMVVMTRPPVRALDLALVVDAGSSMRVWDRTLDELQQILAQVGAFRTVSRWSLHLRGDHVRLADAGGREHPVGRLIDPSGSRLVLLATDAVGDGWYSRAVWKDIESLVSAMPTAVLQMLPRGYWAETALGHPYVTAHAPHPGAPNSTYLMRKAVWMPQTRGFPVPIVDLTPAALKRWALAAVTGTEWAEGVTTDPALLDEEETPTAVNSRLSRAELVRTFVDRASPGAVRLAQLLSSAPRLTSAVVDLLQQRLMPETGISERAEIFVSGLLEEVSGGFRFVPEAARALQEGATSFERWDTFDVVTEYLLQRPGIGGDLRVLVPDRDGGQQLNGHDEPFAAWARDLAQDLGVRFERFNPLEDGIEAADGLLPPDPPVNGARRSAPDRQDPLPPAERPLVPAGTRALDRPAGEVFAEAVAILNGVPLNVVDVGRRGIATFDVRRDAIGTPHSTAHRPTSWEDLGGTELSERSVARAARLRPEVADLLVCTHPDGPLARRAMDMLLTARPQASAVIEPDARVSDLIDTAITETPLYQPYELVALRRGAGGLRLSTVPMFPAGARRGDVAELVVRCEPVAGRNTVLAIVTRVGDQPRLVAKLSAALPPGRRSLTAVLTGPGEVSFQGLETSPVETPWSDLVAHVSRDRHRPSDRIHLICAVEVGGPAEQFLERLSRIRQIITTLDQSVPADRLWVSLVQYGEHSFEYQRLRDPSPDALWTVSADRVLQELAWLERRGTRPTAYPRAAMVEDMLALVAGFVPATGSGAGRTALVIIGERPPHPPRQGRSPVHPCPRHFDWKKSIDRLRMQPGMAIGAICDQPPDRLHLSWHAMSDVPPAHLDTVDVRGLIDDLGLPFLAPVHVPFPLAEGA